MVQYIKTIAMSLRDAASKDLFAPADALLPALCEELHRLDPRDLLPRSQASFVHIRGELDVRMRELSRRRVLVDRNMIVADQSWFYITGVNANRNRKGPITHRRWARRDVPFATR